MVHDETNLSLAFMLGNFEPPLPTPVGVFYCAPRPTYDAAMNKQLEDANAKQGAGDLQTLLQRAIPGRSTRPPQISSRAKARRLQPPGFFH